MLMSLLATNVPHLSRLVLRKGISCRFWHIRNMLSCWGQVIYSLPYPYPFGDRICLLGYIGTATGNIFAIKF